jgi:hypothetical protein
MPVRAAGYGRAVRTATNGPRLLRGGFAVLVRFALGAGIAVHHSAVRCVERLEIIGGRRRRLRVLAGEAGFTLLRGTREALLFFLTLQVAGVSRERQV